MKWVLSGTYIFVASSLTVAAIKIVWCSADEYKFFHSWHVQEIFFSIYLVFKCKNTVVDDDDEWSVLERERDRDVVGEEEKGNGKLKFLIYFDKLLSFSRK